MASEALVAREAGPADRRAQLPEELVARGRDHDVAIARFEAVVGRRKRMLIAHALAARADARKYGCRRVGDREDRVLVGEVERARDARALALQQRRGDAEAEVEAADEIGERAARAHRRPVRKARDREQAARRLRHDVVRRLPRPRPGRPEARERGDHASGGCAPGSRRRQVPVRRASPSGSSPPRRRPARTGVKRVCGPRACANRG